MNLDRDQARAAIVQVVTRCELYADAIYVRELVDGRWQSVALAELAPERRAGWIAGFIWDRLERLDGVNARHLPGE